MNRRPNIYYEPHSIEINDEEKGVEPIEQRARRSTFPSLSSDDMKKVATEFILQPFPIDNEEKVLPAGDTEVGYRVVDIMKRGSITRRGRAKSLRKLQNDDRLYVDRRGVIRVAEPDSPANEETDLIDISWMPQMPLVKQNLGSSNVNLINPKNLDQGLLKDFYGPSPPKIYNMDYRKWVPKTDRERELQVSIKLKMKGSRGERPRFWMDKRGRLRAGSPIDGQSDAMRVNMFDPIWAGWAGVPDFVFPKTWEDISDGTDWAPDAVKRQKSQFDNIRKTPRAYRPLQL